MESLVSSTYYFCWQGEVGVGLPGSRGERGDPGTRVRHQQYERLNFHHRKLNRVRHKTSFDFDSTVICLLQGEEGRAGLDGERGPTVNNHLLSCLYISYSSSSLFALSPQCWSYFKVFILRSAHWKGGDIIMLSEVLSQFSDRPRTLQMCTSNVHYFWPI